MADEYEVVTVRMPKELHKQLRDAALQRKTSMNRISVFAIQKELGVANVSDRSNCSASDREPLRSR